MMFPYRCLLAVEPQWSDPQGDLLLLAMHFLAPFGSVSLTAGRALIIVAAGLAAGIFNGVAGGGSLITFPVLIAIGYTPLTANFTNTVGILPGYVSGVAGFKDGVAGQRRRLLSLMPFAVVGALIGAALLLNTSSEDFRDIAPWLVLLASALFAVQPLLVRFIGRPEDRSPHLHRFILFGGTFLISIYGGYFGAALGVMLLAVLGLTIPDTMARTGVLRSVISLVVNGVAALVFVIHAALPWGAVGCLALGSLFGGWIGARVALRMPTKLFRVIVVVVGVVTAVRLLTQ
jgi:uncharacterized protein